LTSECQGDRVLRLEEVPGQPHMVRILFEHREPLDVSLQFWVNSGFRSGQEISREDLEQLEAEGTRALFYNKALYYLRVRDRTRQEVLQYLLRKECPEHVASSIVADLESSGYIDDTAYARRFIEARKSALSRNELRWKLRQRGIAHTIIAELLARDGAYDEFAAARELGAKQWRRRRYEPVHTRRNKVGAYLQRKGFPTSVIVRVLEDLCTSDGADTCDVP
jgi:regulatory protein